MDRSDIKHLAKIWGSTLTDNFIDQLVSIIIHDEFNIIIHDELLYQDDFANYDYDANEEGYDAGYNDGLEEGYNTGYEDGVKGTGRRKLSTHTINLLKEKLEILKNKA